MKKTFGLVIHGGAGVITRSALSSDLEQQYRAALTDASDTGYIILERGGTALDAVVAAVAVLEENPLFNAGRGSVLNADGQCELDASIMDGRSQSAGAVAGLRHIRNPITLARAVMEKSEHVMLIGDGAERFAQEQGFSLVPNEYFQTTFRRQQWEQARSRDARKAPLCASPGSGLDEPAFGPGDEAYLTRQTKFGTVGCVALDQEGNLAAGTSTGGMTNKKFGRIGDSPIIGAGTYANNATCAVSATGWGEFFIRGVVAYDIAAQMEYKDASVAAAAAATIAKVGRLGGDGGVIAIDRAGRIAMPFNTPGMYRAYQVAGGEAGVEIYGVEP
ncbi:isoaspartyl peptidase/L-asparaginase family protein [Horticoccus sp. 23ND18S-11]|uniref:isoaspartyl peptidase/L-asparaginase family protein n=1 Tax=Horticoccus sp. 23ND18S-11 TaxID=3391832 RepID=UPI0039C8D990